MRRLAGHKSIKGVRDGDMLWWRRLSSCEPPWEEEELKRQRRRGTRDVDEREKERKWPKNQKGPS